MEDYFQKHMYAAVDAALAAGYAILKVYSKPDFRLEIKPDFSPVTEADHAAHEIITNHLLPTGIPILSEEGRDISFGERKTWPHFWLVDPLDGTKEFIRKNGEFTVNIALVVGQEPKLGILYAPVLDLMYFSDINAGAFRLESCSKIWNDIKTLSDLLKASEKLPLKKNADRYRVVVSRSHINQQTENYIAELEKTHKVLEIVSRGSALKFCLLAEGSADIYPRFGPTMEWDTGAGHAIAIASGCKLTLQDGESPLIYNKEILLNPWFIVRRIQN